MIRRNGTSGKPGKAATVNGHLKNASILPINSVSISIGEDSLVSV
jgi:hypothetical protein